MNLLQEKRRALGVHRLYKGGSSSSNASSNTTENTTNSTSINTTQTTNNDRRLVLQDAMAIGDGSSFWSSSNSVSDNDTQTTVYSNVEAADASVLRTFAGAMPDAVKALGNAGADIIKSAGGAVVDLNRDSIAANSKTWDSTLKYGSDFVDRGIDMLSESFGLAQSSINQAYGTANKAVEAFTPTENKNADIGKYAMLAAAAVCALVFLKDAK